MGFTYRILKYVGAFVLLLINYSASQSQTPVLDSLRTDLNRAKPESAERAAALGGIADYYAFLQFDSCIFYSNKTIEISTRLNYRYGMYLGYISAFHGMNCQGNFPKALDAAQNLERAIEQLRNDSPWVVPYAPYFPGVLHRAMEDYPNAIAKFKESIELQKNVGSIADAYASLSQLANIYLSKGVLDSALYYARLAYASGLKTSRFTQFVMISTNALGNIHLALNNTDSASVLFHHAIEQSRHFENPYFEALNYTRLAALFIKTNSRDSCLFYAHKALTLCVTHNFPEFTLTASRILAGVYDKEKNADSALKYTRMMLAAKDSIFSQAKVRQFQQESFNDIQRLQRLNVEKERSQNRLRIYGLSVAMILFLFLAFIMFRSARQRRKAAAKIEKAYHDLKATQAQLIQSEKMASLGELTAGIAHEIQNPLNFVNNFSEVNQELFDEMEMELKNGSPAEAYSIASNIRQNLEKINQHGKRAESIVKGMLLHSRASTGQKELTDLNALADEYLRLSYHGMRAKDKSFNCEIRTEFDLHLGKVNLIPQDIGRVLMNIYNNAFYSLAEKMRKTGDGFKPLLIARTSLVGGKAEILIQDNGLGVATEIIDKIFQPFFTTKPTGQGTGLGLSLSYDIITKEHGGTISVESSVGEGAAFKIQLPLS